MPSLRTEQDRLREQLRTAGMGAEVIAAEFASRYGLRPRAAWRHAHGWALTRAAGHISSEAAAAGVHPDGRAVAMTASHLWEHENWPGPGSRTTGRKPTPYVLALLARTYGAGIPDLLDTQDYRNLSPADRLIIEACSPAACRYIPPPRALVAAPRPAAANRGGAQAPARPTGARTAARRALPCGSSGRTAGVPA